MGRQAANPAERFDPEGGKSPEGEWMWEAQSGALAVAGATGLDRGRRRNRGKPVSGVEVPVERALETAGEEAK